MLDTIKNFITNGWSTLKGLLKLEWINFKNWKGWTSLRALYILCAILSIVYTCWYGVAYFIICAFFKVEPILWCLNKLGFSKTEIQNMKVNWINGFDAGNKKEKYYLEFRLGTFTVLELKWTKKKFRFMLFNLGVEI